MSSLTEQGVAALRAGDKALARERLRAALDADRADARAWLWLSGALSDPAEQRFCLERTLALDPANSAARQGLVALGGVTSREPVWGEGERGSERERAGEAEGRGAHAAPAMRASSAWSWLSAGLAGASALLAWASWRQLGRVARPWELLELALVAGFPLGWTVLLFAGVLLRTSGRWLGGRASASQVRAALGQALAPAAIGVIVWGLQLVFLPEASFAGGAAEGAQELLVRALGLLHWLLWLFAAWASMVTLANAHGITWARAAGSWLLACLIIVASLVAIFGGSAILITLRGG